MRNGYQRVWSSIVICCFTALAFLVLSYSPANLSAAGGAFEDCVVSPSAQMEGYCCVCSEGSEGGPGICFKQLFGHGFDRCQFSPVWCPEDEMSVCDGTPE